MKRIAFLAAMLLSMAASAQNLKPYGVVELSANMMREKPDYAAELGDQALMGTVVELLETSSYWIKIKSPEPYTAWVNEMGIVQMTEAEKDAYIAAPKYIFKSEYGHIYSEPDKKSLRVSDFVMGDLVRKCLQDGQPVAEGDFLKVMLPSGKTGWVTSNTVVDFTEWANRPAPKAKDILKIAKYMVGVPYMWGGTSVKNVDCSGLSRTAFFLNGILLPRNASQQQWVGEEVPVDVKYLKPGDLLFWGRAATADKPARATHVGIYIGEGKFIHSSQMVRINSLDVNEADGYKRAAPICARRILGNQDADKGIISIAKSPWYFKQ